MTLAGFAAVSAAMYAGTSALLGIVREQRFPSSLTSTQYLAGLALAIADRRQGAVAGWPTHRAVFEARVQQPLDYLLAPLFFASIGSAIPIKSLFVGEVVWQGVAFAALMAVGKVRCPLAVSLTPKIVVGVWIPLSQTIGRLSVRTLFRREAAIEMKPAAPPAEETTTAEQPAPDPAKAEDEPATSRDPAPPPQEPARTSTWVPTLLLGAAMTARGEIGLIISQVALSAGALSERPYLLSIWAILLTTLAGPILVAVIVRRVAAMPPEWA